MKNEGPDLSTTYLGLELKNPLVPSASPLSREVSTVRKLEDSGAAAVVVYSLFEEEVRHEAQEIGHLLEYGTESYAEALSFFPEAESYHHGPDEYLEHIRRLKDAVDIPIIGSLNGVTAGGWVDYARGIEEAGADAIELNVYFMPADPSLDGREVENRYVEVLEAVRSRVNIPVAIKLSPYFSAPLAMVKRLDSRGADGFVLFNRFYQPDIDLENLEVYPNVKLSDSDELRLPLRWIAILRGKVLPSLAATSGIHSSADVLKMLLVGADVTMLCSVLLRHGAERISDLLTEIRQWLEEKEYASVEELKGSMSHRSTADPTAFERANYMRALNTFM